MPAVVETMMFQGKLPWHGEGTPIDREDCFSVEKGLEKSGCDWEVHLKDLMTVDKAQSAVNYAATEGNAFELKPNVSHRAVVRETDGSVLGVVGARYTPLQNKQAFEFFQPYLDAEEAFLHTAGSLYSGRKVWVLAQINSDSIEVVKGDEVCPFLLLSNSHDGTSAVRIGFTPIRVVCANTLSFAHSNSASKLIRIRHSGQVETNLERIRETMSLATREFEATVEQYQSLAAKQMNVADLRKFVKIVLAVDNVHDADLKTRTKNTLDQIIGLCESGQGNTLPKARGTWWSAYNGVNEYFNHVQGRNNNNRLGSLWFGVNEAKNRTALEIALEMAG